MKHAKLTVLHISDRDIGGGAARIAYELHLYCLEMDLNSHMIVGHKSSNTPSVHDLRDYQSSWYIYMGKLRQFLRNKKFVGSWRLEQFIRIIQAPFFYFESRMGWENFAPKEAQRFLKKSKLSPDIIHCHNLHGRYFDMRLLKRFKLKKVIISMHDPWIIAGHCSHFFSCMNWKSGCGRCPDLKIFPSIARDATKWNLYRKSMILKFVNPQMVGCCHWVTNLFNSSVHAPNIRPPKTIYLGVNRSVFVPANKEKAKESLGLATDTPLMFFAASVFSTNPYKGYHVLENALELLGHTYQTPTHLICLGEQEREFKIGNTDVSWLPYQSDTSALIRYYQAADVFLYPSLVDTYPLSPMEAICCGTPVIATTVGGIPEIFQSFYQSPHPAVSDTIHQTKIGFLTPPNRSDLFSQAMEHYLTDRATQFSMIHTCSHLEESHFNIKKSYLEYLHLYEAR